MTSAQARSVIEAIDLLMDFIEDDLSGYSPDPEEAADTLDNLREARVELCREYEVCDEDELD